MNNINSFMISRDIQILSEYTSLIRYMKDNSEQYGKKNCPPEYYLRIVGDHLEVTGDKYKRATEKQLCDYVYSLKYNIAADQKINGVTSEKKDLLNRLSDVFNNFINVSQNRYDELSEKDVIDLSVFRVSISEENPFYGTDLIVFKDSYSGVLPINGIKESLFNEMTKLIKRLEKVDRTLGLIIDFPPEDEGRIDDAARNMFIDMIIMLCTRQIGRELVFSLANQNTPVYICTTSDESLYDQVECAIRILLNDIGRWKTYTGGVPEGMMKNRKKKEILPLFLILAHEMCHALHHIFDSSFHEKLSEEIPFLTNLEEQHTILGWSKKNYGAAFPLREDSLKNGLNSENDETIDFKKWGPEGDWDQQMEVDENKPVHFEWEKLSENGLCSVFGLGIRFDHFGDDVSESKWLLNQKKKIMQKIKNGQDCFEFFTPLFIERMTRSYGWQKFLGEITKKAFEHENWSVVNELVKRGVEIGKSHHVQDKLNGSLIYALVDQDENAIHHLLEIGADPKLQKLSSQELGFKLRELYLHDLKAQPKKREKLRKKLESANFKAAIEISIRWDQFLILVSNQLDKSKLEKTDKVIKDITLDKVLQDAWKNDRWDVLTVLKETGNNLSKVLENARKNDRWDIVLLLKEAGYDVGKLPQKALDLGLIKAIIANDEMSQWSLLKLGANPVLQDYNSAKLNALEKVMKNGFALNDLENEFVNDEDVVLAAIGSRGVDTLYYIGEMLKNDEQFFRSILARYPDAVQYAGERLQENKELALFALWRSKNPLNLYLNAFEKIKDDDDIVLFILYKSNYSVGGDIKDRMDPKVRERLNALPAEIKQARIDEIEARCSQFLESL